MTHDWARLGKALQAARKARGIDQVRIGELIGVGRSAVQKIERGDMKKVTPTLRAFAAEVGWAPGSIDAVLAGREPELAAQPVLEPDSGPTVNASDLDSAHLPLRIVRDLTGPGALVDATVLPLEDDDEEIGRMVIVVKGKPKADPQTIRRALEAWERQELMLRGVDDEGEPPAAEEA
ncbi:helix-turn-helix domain-containing protein [Streptomyces fenghuangensis]